jgi:superfamily I DNA/RNA helicase
MELDSEQQEVVDYKNSCVVIAGPGSGKTRTLVAKAEELWLDTDIICLTFTRAAAREMRQRMPGVKAQTIHSYCYGEVGWPGNYDKLLPKFLVKDEKETYDWVLVDEVQDLTEEELNVVLSIVGNKLFAVGDPYQSIYGWNGALGMNVFRKLSDTKVFNLRNNYRSCPKIVDWLNSVYGRQLVSKGVVENGLTAILCRTNMAVWEVTQLLEEAEIGFTVRIGASEARVTTEEDHGDDKLKVMTCHCSKGLEFDNVILYNWIPEPFWGEEKNLFYVSMARASMNYCEANQYNLVSNLKGRNNG